MEYRPFDFRESITTWVREHREVLPLDNNEKHLKPNLTVFVGLYNAESFWSDVVSNLERQSTKAVSLLLVDNASSDRTWDLIKAWVPKGFLSVVKVRNPINLGGFGSFHANLDLIDTDWVVTLHQDDIYYSNHVETLLQKATSAPPEVALVTTSMDSLTPNGGQRFSLPRANWIIDTTSPVSVFLSHLRFHALPFPAACFRLRALLPIELPLHDTSFQDTELVLRLCGNWEFITTSTATMAYRENPISKSHVLTKSQRSIGQAQALVRVFSSVQFKDLLKKIEAKERDEFFEHAVESIHLRMDDEVLSNYVLSAMTDAMVIEWGYGSRSLARHIQSQMKTLGNSFADSFLEFSAELHPPKGAQMIVTSGTVTKLRTRDSALLPIQRFIYRTALKLVARTSLRKIRPDLDFYWRRKR